MEKFSRHTVTGITTPVPQAPDVPGFIGVSYVTLGDINKDGINEIVATSGLGQASNALGTHDGEVALFTWDGQNIDSWTQTVLTNDFAFPNETVLRDFDGDNRTDIMVLDNFLFCMDVGGIYYLRNKGGDIASPSNWEKRTIYQGGNDPVGQSAYHRAVFVDLDGDGLEDFITSKISYCLYTQDDGSPYAWIEWFKNDGGGSFSGPFEIGQGGGFLFWVDDINQDGLPDVLAPQFFITAADKDTVRGSAASPDQRGASLLWYANPGTTTPASDPWKSYIIDYWHTSKNPLGKVMEVITSDIDGDGQKELLASTHNHQNWVDADKQLRYWPGGVFALEIPRNPKRTRAWQPVTIDAGDPDLDPADAAAVAADPFAVDRSPDPASQGSPGMVRAADVNADGIMDLVLPGDGKGALYYYEGQGLEGSELRFKRAVLFADPKCVPGDSQIYDIDKDGKLDIISCFFDTSVNKNTKSGTIFIYKQK